MSTKTQTREPPTQEQARWHDADELRWAARHWAVRIGVKTPQIHLRQMTNKWASISTSGRLTLNTELLALAKPLGEFVIVHELVHLLAPNHGKVFKSFLHAYLPDWEEREQQLRQGTPSEAQPATLQSLAQKDKGISHQNGGQPMSLTPQQKRLAQTIDQWVQSIEQEGGGETELLAKAFLHMGTFKQLLDASTPEQMNALCALYPGFYRFAQLLEKLAQRIQDGTVIYQRTWRISPR